MNGVVRLTATPQVFTLAETLFGVRLCKKILIKRGKFAAEKIQINIMQNFTLAASKAIIN